MSNAWIGVVGALGGVILTGLLGLATAVLNHRWTAQAARSQRRYDVALKRAETRRVAYARFLGATDNVRDAAETAEPPVDTSDRGKLAVWYRTEPDLFREMQVADSEAKIVASDAVFSAMEAFEEALANFLNAVFDDPDNADSGLVWETHGELLAAMRAEQAGDLGP